MRANVRFEVGDMFFRPADVYVNPVNCMSKMGKGLAKVFKERFPAIDFPYNKACESGRLKPGKPLLVPSRETKSGDSPFVPLVCLFPTKDHWSNHSRIEWIREGLENLIENEDKLIGEPGGLFKPDRRLVWNFPLLGAGLGGLQVYDVALTMILALRVAPFDSNIFVARDNEIGFLHAKQKLLKLELFDGYEREVLGLS